MNSFYVDNFQTLVNSPFKDDVNALCWKRELVGDFNEIVRKLTLNNLVTEISEEDLLSLELTSAGQLARTTIISDLKLLQEHGAQPVLNLIKHYERAEDDFFFPTDVYSWHVDRAPIPTATFLCTYHGATSEMVENTYAQQKITIPRIEEELRSYYDPNDGSFQEFLIENFFDLHYEVAPNAPIIKFEQGHIWRLAVDHPDSPVLPCVHRAPVESDQELRLMIIC